jgi:hypothetical protein
MSICPYLSENKVNKANELANTQNISTRSWAKIKYGYSEKNRYD